MAASSMSGTMASLTASSVIAAANASPSPSLTNNASPIVAFLNSSTPLVTTTPNTTSVNATVSANVSAQGISVGVGVGAGVNPNKHVFAHFMVGIVSTYNAAAWQSDISLAKSKGITGFALNCGTDPYNQAQLDLAYAAAQTVGDFSLFISFDFNWWSLSDTSGVASLLSRYIGQSPQLLINGAAYTSSFIGDGFDWGSVQQQVGKPLYNVPFWQPSQGNADNAALSGLFSWSATAL